MTEALPVPFGLDSDPELWIIVNEDGAAYICRVDAEMEHFVATARSEADLYAAWMSFNDSHDAPKTGIFARTTEPSLLRAIRSVPTEALGFIVFDHRGTEVLRVYA